MSFNINGPSNKPVIQEAQNMMNNGGGGNLGYFMREDSEESLKFVNSDEEDCFEKSIEKDEFQDSEDLLIIDRLIRLLKRIWRIIVQKFSPAEKIKKDDYFVLKK